MKDKSGLFNLTPPKTGTVWDYIHPTQPNYPDTELPRSFNIDTNAGQIWVHGNATEHIQEEIELGKTKMTAPTMKSINPKFYTQLLLDDFRNTLNKIISLGYTFGKMYTEGNWEITIVKDKKGGKNPIVKHAQFLGWGH